ncbi:hypothetical protein [Rothia nasimurium]|uniref:hypothetical protein n=1 Tax=Rothia nasimurium TaxID=85336 RepID=UPI001D16785C|nr:hypothetical protein [Rothia nasimurium]
MTHDFSRRTLAKGAAWAAPAVVAAAAIPAYAASPTCPDDIDAQVDTVFQIRLAYLPSLTNTTIRLWYTAEVHVNGALSLSNLKIQTTNGGALDVSDLPFGFEFAQRNVDTSEAINRTLGGTVVRGLQIPTRTSANGRWNTRTGEPSATPTPMNVDDPNAINQRDVSHGSSYVTIYSADGRYNNLGAGEFGEETGVAEGNHLKWIFVIKPKTDATSSAAQTSLINSHWRNGGYAGGRIYTSLGVRPIGFLPPSFDEVRASVGSSVDEACLLTAYTKRVDIWNNSNERFAGATIKFSGWAHDASGDVKAVTYSGKDYVWSHEIGNFMALPTAGLNGDRFNARYSNAREFFGSALGGLTQGYNTGVGKEFTYHDGIW